MRRRLLAASALALAAIVVPTAAQALPPPGGGDDLTAPTITIKAPPGAWSGWYGGPATFEVSATDDDRVESLTWTLTGAQTGTGTKLGGTTTYVPVTAPGVTTLTVTASDPTGNTSEKTWGIGIDTVAPTISTDLPQGTQVPWGSTRTLNFNCVDNWSGVAGCEGTLATGASLPTDTLGDKTVTITAVDNVGHRRAVSVPYSVVPAEFRVDRRAQIAGQAKVGATLTLVPGLWVPEPEQRQYVWVRDGNTIPGATGTTYQVTPEDVGHQLWANEIVSRPFYREQRAGTNAVSPTPGDLTTTSQPVVEGSAAVGARLAFRPPTVSPAPDEAQVRWLRDGTVVGSGASYDVTAADAGRALAVEYRARRLGYHDLVRRLEIGRVAVPPAPRTGSTTVAKVRLAPRRAAARIVVRVRAAGTVPTGTVTVRRAGRVVKVQPLRDGTVTLPWARKPRARQVLVLSYSGSPTVAPSQVTVKVPAR